MAELLDLGKGLVVGEDVEEGMEPGRGQDVGGRLQGADMGPHVDLVAGLGRASAAAIVSTPYPRGRPSACEMGGVVSVRVAPGVTAHLGVRGQEVRCRPLGLRFVRWR
jgi:hypothetical protein